MRYINLRLTYLLTIVKTVLTFAQCVLSFCLFVCLSLMATGFIVSAF